MKMLEPRKIKIIGWHSLVILLVSINNYNIIYYTQKMFKIGIKLI